MTDIVERRKPERRNKALVQRIQMLMQSTIESIYILGDQGNVIEANEAFCKHLGYSQTELLQLSVFDFEARLTADEVRANIKKLLNNPARFESLHRRKDGSLVNAEITASGVKLNGGRYLFCLCHDITARKVVESKLKKSERHLREAQSIAHIGSWDYDLVTLQLMWTEELYRIYGVSPETFVPSPESLISLIHPDDQPAMRAWIEACTLGQEPPALEFKCEWPDGQIRYIEGQGALSTECDGEFIRISGTAQDITERKQVELKVKVSEIRYRTLFEQTADYVLVLEPSDEGHPIIVDANEAAFKKFGYSRSEMIGKPVTLLDREARSEELVVESVRMLRAGKLVYFEVEHVCKDGSLFWADVAVKGVTIGGKHLFYSVERDITDRKQIEIALAESMRKLEEKELAKTRFFAAAGHDLRQPLAAAGLFIDALKFTELTPRQSKLVEQLDDSMTTFGGLLNTLLNISKLESGTIKPEYTPINVIEVFNWLERNFVPMAGEKQIGFRLYFSLREKLVVLSDIGLLNSILMNLVSNAIKFTSKGAVLISARKRGSDVLFQVWDTGMGIPDENIERIFDEFYQANNAQRDRVKGLGLGLAIARRSITLLGSKITCRSRIGRGSVFEFRLPLCNTTRETEQQADTKVVQEEVIDEAFARGKHFIVVEDDVLVAQAMTDVLEGMGGEVTCFDSAEDALRHTSIEHADYYIIDYRLGGALNGMQFLNLLRQKLGKPVSAVLLTGDTSTQFIREAENCNCPVLYKPVNTARLISTLSAQKTRLTDRLTAR